MKIKKMFNRLSIINLNQIKNNQLITKFLKKLLQISNKLNHFMKEEIRNKNCKKRKN